MAAERSSTTTATAITNRLFRNRGDGTFEDVSAGSGADVGGYGMGVATGDFDADGWMDLYITNVGPNTLLHNRGDGTFEDVSERAGVDDAAWGASAAFVDYDRDGDLDLFVANYIDWSIETDVRCSSVSGAPDYCSPMSYQAPAPDTLLRNDGDGTFTNVSTDAGVHAAFGNGLGVVCGDFDGDDLVDIFVANDQTANQLWHNRGDGTFEDIAMVAGCAVDDRGEAKAGMGVTTEDFDGDGDLDLLVVNLTSQSDSFFRNEGSYFFDDTARVGLGGDSRRYTRFGLGVMDFDNDGWLDIFHANGRVTKPATPDPLRSDDIFAEPNQVFAGGPGGRFAARPPLPDIQTSRAAAFGDVDGDGGIDILVVNRDGPAHLLRNVHVGGGRWLMLDVRHPNGAVAIGATVMLELGERRLRREVRTASSYCAANDHRVHFGLGSEARIGDISVRWPD
ncbi:MAG: CRTAC1 family protein, partial [Planctomycetota bacterium]